jgi:hypothetical protein
MIRVEDVSDGGAMRSLYYSIIHPTVTAIAVHEPLAIPHIHRIVKEFYPLMILETGTSWGGMSLILHECNPHAILHSWDIESSRKPNKSLFNHNVNFHLESILNPNKLLTELCKRDKRKLLYLDNGNKALEAQLYVPLLNAGDMFAVHDWNKEISFCDVSNLIEDFEPIEHELFEENNWSTRFWKRKSPSQGQASSREKE